MTENNQPAFWLEVRKEYVIDNFESLLRYLRYYNYHADKEAPDGDFEKSYACLKQVVYDYIQELRTANLSKTSTASTITDENTGLRMIAAYLLASDKKHKQDAATLLTLTDYLIVNGYCENATVQHDLYELILQAAQLAPVARYGFSWDDIAAGELLPHLFAAKLAKTQFGAPDSKKYWYYEGKGLLHLEGEKLELANLNLYQYIKAQLISQIQVKPGFNIVVRNSERTNKTEFPELLKLNNLLANEQVNVTPSPVPKLREYSAGDELTVRLTYVGNEIHAESIDPRYEKVKGRIYITNDMFYIPLSTWSAKLQCDNYLRVQRMEHPGFAFNVDPTFEQFYESMGENKVHNTYNAVFFQTFPGGVRYVTEEGLLVNIFGVTKDSIDEEKPTRVLINGCRRDKQKHVVLNGEFSYDTNTESELSGKDFINDAQEWLIEEFSGDSEPEDIPVDTRSLGGRIPEEAVTALCHLLYASSANQTDTRQRYQRIMAARMLATMTGNDSDTAYLNHEINYQNAIIRFAMGESIKNMATPDDAGFNASRRTEGQERVLQLLSSYVDERIVSNIQNNQFSNDDMRYLEQLINASNTLNGKIDTSETNRIKKSIATFLGVGDLYQNICHDLTYYGEESDTLEFKTSIVFPAGNMQPDLTTQKWAILKAVCGFLNTVSGGELLLGVNDKGYANGLSNDLTELYRQHLISDQSMDKFRLFVKYTIDQAFVDDENITKGSDITATHIRYLIEKNNEGIEILRIQVQPYEYGIVSFNNEQARPEYIRESYYRTSGATVPMSREIKKMVMEKKVQMSMDDVTRAMLQLRQARKERHQVILHDYTSKHGKRDRRVEGYQILTEQQAVIAYDTEKKEIREYKIARIGNVEITNHLWQYASKHKTLKVDVFDMLESPREPAVAIELKLSNLASNLIREEHPTSEDCLVENTQADRTEYPYILRTEVFGMTGVGRFYLGLLRDIKVVKGQQLIDYAREYVSELTK